MKFYLAPPKMRVAPQMPPPQIPRPGAATDFTENQGDLSQWRAQEMSLVSGNSRENFGPVVMEMTSAKPKIRHVFGFTCLTEER